MPDMELDVTGMVCPQPVAIVRRTLAELEPGDELVVVGDDPPSERSIRRTCLTHGYEVETDPAPDDEASFSLRIRVTDDAVLGADADQEPSASGE